MLRFCFALLAVAVTASGCASQPRPLLAAELTDEAASCSGIDDAVGSKPSFLKSGVRSVERVTAPRLIGGKALATRTAGVRIVLHATPGLTQPWLERVIACRAVVSTSAGSSPAGSSSEADPLVVPGAVVRVERIEGAFVVEITSDSAEGAAEIARRASALTGR